MNDKPKPINATTAISGKIRFDGDFRDDSKSGMHLAGTRPATPTDNLGAEIRDDSTLHRNKDNGLQLKGSYDTGAVDFRQTELLYETREQVKGLEVFAFCVVFWLVVLTAIVLF